MSKKIIDTGKHRPKAKIWDLWELMGKRDKLVVKPIQQQSRNDGTIIYGRHAVNKLLGPGYHRDTYDFDIYSGMPLKHAVQIEKSIDRGTNSNLAYVERSSHRKGLFRVRTRPNETVEADFNPMKQDVKFVTIKGVRYEQLGPAEKKYTGMINRGEMHRFPNAFFDLNDIQTHKLIKNSRWRKRR